MLSNNRASGYGTQKEVAVMSYLNRQRRQLVGRLQSELDRLRASPVEGRLTRQRALLRASPAGWPRREKHILYNKADKY